MNNEDVLKNIDAYDYRDALWLLKEIKNMDRENFRALTVAFYGLNEAKKVLRKIRNFAKISEMSEGNLTIIIMNSGQWREILDMDYLDANMNYQEYSEL